MEKLFSVNSLTHSSLNVRKTPVIPGAYDQYRETCNKLLVIGWIKQLKSCIVTMADFEKKVAGSVLTFNHFRAFNYNATLLIIGLFFYFSLNCMG